jgi:hypothetical protein
MNVIFVEPAFPYHQRERHPDYDYLRLMLDSIGETRRVRAT